MCIRDRNAEDAKAKAAEFERSKKEKEIELNGLKEAYKAAKEQYDNAKIYLNGLQSNEQEKIQVKERAEANVNKYESQISNLHKEVDSLNESIASDSAKIREYDTKIDELQSALDKADQNNGGNIYSIAEQFRHCLLYTSPSPRDLSTSRMPSSA